MRQYEVPKISFKKLNIFEAIAETCWGYQKVEFDNPYDGIVKNEVLLFDKPGCGNKKNDIIDWLKDILGSNWSKYESSRPDNNSSNLANTKATGFFGNYS